MKHSESKFSEPSLRCFTAYRDDWSKGIQTNWGEHGTGFKPGHICSMVGAPAETPSVILILWSLQYWAHWANHIWGPAQQSTGRSQALLHIITWTNGESKTPGSTQGFTNLTCVGEFSCLAPSSKKISPVQSICFRNLWTSEQEDEERAHISSIQMGHNRL